MMSDPIAARIRGRRLALGLSFRKLAALAGLASPAYVFHIENGTKLPSEETAARLALALGEDEHIFRAWARCRNRGDLEPILAAAAVLRAASESLDPPAPTSAPFAWASAITEHGPARDRARLRVPVLAAGLDPGDHLRPTCAVLGHLRIDVSDLPDPTTWVRPIAYRIADRDQRRVPELTAGDLALVTRAAGPPRPFEVCAVRHRGSVLLTRVLWNGRALVLLPSPGTDDFDVLVTPDRETLRAMLVGVVVRVLPGTESRTTTSSGPDVRRSPEGGPRASR